MTLEFLYHVKKKVTFSFVSISINLVWWGKLKYIRESLGKISIAFIFLSTKQKDTKVLREQQSMLCNELKFLCPFVLKLGSWVLFD